VTQVHKAHKVRLVHKARLVRLVLKVKPALPEHKAHKEFKAQLVKMEFHQL
jgi:hypothetical protein